MNVKGNKSNMLTVTQKIQVIEEIKAGKLTQNYCISQSKIMIKISSRQRICFS
ncbi:MAG: hypothetical protein ACRC8P_00720 [Spiroplasma sp.]